MSADRLQISSEMLGDSGRLRLVGELDIASAPRLREATDSMLAQPVSRLVIDLSELAFIDSSGLRLLIDLHDRSGAERWSLALLNPSAAARSLFEVTGADHNLPLHEERQVAQRERPAENEGHDASHAPLQLELERNVEAPALARAAVSELSAALGLGAATVHTLVLLVSELVTNAVLHSSGPREAPIRLAASASGDAVRVTVTDAGGGFEPRPRDPASISDGYGLYLLEKAATRWGVDTLDSTSVWFELPLTAG